MIDTDDADPLHETLLDPETTLEFTPSTMTPAPRAPLEAAPTRVHPGVLARNQIPDERFPRGGDTLELLPDPSLLAAPPEKPSVVNPPGASRRGWRWALFIALVGVITWVWYLDPF